MKRLVLASSLAVALVWSGSLSVSGQIPPYGGVTQYLADLAARRAKTMAALGPETILIAWSAPTRVYSTDVDYEYRQESNLLYLTGIDQDDTILVLVPGAKTRKEILFTREGEPRREHWEGHTMTPAEVTAASGIATVYPLAGFQPFVDALLGGTGFQQSNEEAAAEFGVFFDAVKQGRARLGILERLGGAGGRGGRGGPPSPPPPGSNAAWALEQQTKYPGLTAFGAASILTGQRQIKTPYEQTVLRRSVEISAEAHVEGMKAARPGRWEYEVEAAIEYWYLRNGALSWGYPSIVGSGPNSTVLHYNKSTRQMKDGDLLLVDAAANFQGLTGDITRTYPVNGRFSSDQRAIYELVLQAQEAGIAAAKAGVATSAVTQACRAVFAQGLLKLGLITEAAPGEAQNAQIGRWFTHGPVHGIGLDVHDPLGQQLAVGSAFVLEPGLYIREVVFDQLPKTPENLTFIEKVRPAVRRFKDMGVRIEDSFILTADGLEMLSAKAPRQIRDIERVMEGGPRR